MTAALADNDILIKVAAYGLASEVVGCLAREFGAVSVLAVARFYVPKCLRRTPLEKGAALALSAFEEVSASLNFLEPDTAETRLAAEIELVARKANLALDVGESQLIAIALLRNVRALVTGDKRAIEGMEPVLQSLGGHEALKNTVICIEQIMKRLLMQPLPALNLAICAEPQIDTALRVCFSCSTMSGSVAEWIAGLDSYIAALRTKAPNVLSP